MNTRVLPLRGDCGMTSTQKRMKLLGDGCSTVSVIDKASRRGGKSIQSTIIGESQLTTSIGGKAYRGSARKLDTLRDKCSMHSRKSPGLVGLYPDAAGPVALGVAARPLVPRVAVGRGSASLLVGWGVVRWRPS